MYQISKISQFLLASGNTVQHTYTQVILSLCLFLLHPLVYTPLMPINVNTSTEAYIAYICVGISRATGCVIVLGSVITNGIWIVTTCLGESLTYQCDW